MTKTTLTPRRHIRKTPRSVIGNKESVYNCFSTLKIAQNYLQTLEALRTKNVCPQIHGQNELQKFDQLSL